MAFCRCLLSTEISHSVVHLKRKQISQRLLFFHPQKDLSCLSSSSCYLSSSITQLSFRPLSCLTLTMLEPKRSAPASSRFPFSLFGSRKTAARSRSQPSHGTQREACRGHLGAVMSERSICRWLLQELYCSKELTSDPPARWEGTVCTSRSPCW